jgi:hypothetical protein
MAAGAFYRRAARIGAFRLEYFDSSIEEGRNNKQIGCFNHSTLLRITGYLIFKSATSCRRSSIKPILWLLVITHHWSAES